MKTTIKKLHKAIDEYKAQELDKKFKTNKFAKEYKEEMDNRDVADWKPVPGYEGSYLINKSGSVVSVKRRYRKHEKVISQCLSKKGYYSVYLNLKSKRKGHLTHRLVAMAFIPNPKDKQEVNHIDCNTKNNHVSNLEWSTHQENMQHALSNNLILKGERHGKAKLNEKDVLAIRSESARIVDIAKKYCITVKNVWAIRSRRLWKHLK